MKKSLPRYFEIDGDILVKVYESGGMTRAINHWGNPYPPMKAIFDGFEVSRAKFDEAVQNRKGQPTYNINGLRSSSCLHSNTKHD